MSKRRFGKLTRRLGRKHGQESVITKKAGKPARLHETESKKPGKSYNLGKEVKKGKNPSGEGETSATKVRGGKLPKKTKPTSTYHYGKKKCQWRLCMPILWTNCTVRSRTSKNLDGKTRNELC